MELVHEKLEFASEISCSSVQGVRNRIFLCWGFYGDKQLSVFNCLVEGRDLN